MKLSDFDYELPESQIAYHPAERRDQSRLLVLDRRRDALEHRHFSDLPDYLTPSDFLVINTTKVLKARLFARKADTGGKCELLLLREVVQGTWECLARPGHSLRRGVRLLFEGSAVTGEIAEVLPNGSVQVRFEPSDQVYALMDALGQIPLPPYIRREAEPSDELRYQTVYAVNPGSVAAPTAGLHFTEALLARLTGDGIETVSITLEIGWGTFKPVRTQDPREHQMERESFRVDAAAAERIRLLRKAGKRLVAIGTTSVRALESWHRFTDGALAPMADATDLFIYPPYEFKLVDKLLTNFHLPQSTLLMLVAAFAGRERVLEAYREAVRLGYRFFSYGDCMLIL